MVKIYIDYRERRIKRILEDYPLDIVNLPVGDYLLQFEGYGVLVERKSARDFISSMKNNRLWEQMRRMLAPEVMEIPIKRRALLIHGTFSDLLLLSGFGWNHIMGAFMEIQFKYGIPIFQAEDDESLQEFFRILIKREEEGKNEGDVEKRWMRVPPRRVMSEQEWKIYILSSLPNVGEKLAKNLLKRFGSIEKIAKANIIELKKVEGIGDKKARQIYRIFH